MSIRTDKKAIVGDPGKTEVRVNQTGSENVLECGTNNFSNMYNDISQPMNNTINALGLRNAHASNEEAYNDIIRKFPNQISRGSSKNTKKITTKTLNAEAEPFNPKCGEQSNDVINRYSVILQHITQF